MKISGFYNNLKQRIKLIKKYKKLGKYVKNKLGVELMNNIEIVPVKQEIDEYKEDIETMEYLQMEKINSNEVCIEFSKRLVGNLKKYINYNCTYTVNIKNGSLINSGYVICDDNLNFIAFASNY